MILASKGKLSVAQVLTGTEISENVIQFAAIDYAAMTDLWWVVDTVIVATTEGAITFRLVMAQAADLVTQTDANYAAYVNVASIEILVIADKRVATVGRHIASMNIGKQLKEMLEEDGSVFPYVGMSTTLAGSTTLGINASLSPTEPQTLHHKMVTVSPVGIPAIASAGSGEPAP